MNDTTITSAIIFIIICHIAILAIGYKMQKTTVFISYLNAVIALGVFVFWAIDSFTLKQPTLEIRTIIVLCLEACILLFALYSILGFHTKTYVKVIHYIGFAMHLLATIGILYFMLTFKFNKLY